MILAKLVLLCECCGELVPYSHGRSYNHQRVKKNPPVIRLKKISEEICVDRFTSEHLYMCNKCFDSVYNLSYRLFDFDEVYRLIKIDQRWNCVEEWRQCKLDKAKYTNFKSVEGFEPFNIDKNQ